MSRHVRKMTDEKIARTKELHAAGKSYPEIEAELDVPRLLVARVVNGTYKFGQPNAVRHAIPATPGLFGVRTCMKCRLKFPPGWKGQWVCVPCRSHSSWRDAAMLAGRYV